MTLPRAAASVATVSILVAASCGYPTFGFDPTGSGGQGGAAATGSHSAASSASDAAASSADGASSSAATTTSTSAGTTSSGTGGGPSCAVTHLLISEVRSRGLGGGSDEFVELYNPTSAAIAMDNTWSIKVRGSGSGTYVTRWQGPMTQAISIPAHGHFLIVGSGYAQSPAGDVMLTGSITTDAASVELINAGTTVDVVCFSYDVMTFTTVEGFTCQGSPASNKPHDDTINGMSNLDTSLARKQNGCASTQDSASDFAQSNPAKPESTTSALVP